MFTVLARSAVCAALFVIALAAPAHPGGPTSAILSVPGEGRTASLYYTDTEYTQLAELLGTTDGTAVSGEVDDSGQTHESGPGVTVTWLIHDVTPWRIDRIYLDAEGGPWVATQAMTGGGGSIGDGPVVWHRPAAGKELSTLLDGLGVGSARATSDGDGVAGAPAPAAGSADDPAPGEPGEAAEPSSVSGAWWALGGLTAGVLLALGWMRARSRREDEPTDLDPDTDWLAPQARSTSAYATPPARRA